MVEFAARLCSEAHYEQSNITSRRHAVLERRERVKRSTVKRRNRLEDCRKLMVFLQNCMEVSLFHIAGHLAIFQDVSQSKGVREVK